MRMTRSLIRQRHQAGKDRAGETRAADPILVVVRTVRECLCLSHEQSRLRIAERGDVGDRPAGEVEPRLLLVCRLRKQTAHPATSTIQPARTRAYERRA